MFEELETLEKELEEIEAREDEDPENEELEKMWDTTYKKIFSLNERIVSEIVSMTSGKIDRKTARAMLTTYPERLKRLFAMI